MGNRRRKVSFVLITFQFLSAAYYNYRAKNPVSVAKELFEKLQRVLLVLANTLEFYHFLSSNCRSLNFSEHVSPAQWSSNDQEQVQGNQNVLLHLYNVLVYTFQQAFYAVSKVSLHVLVMKLGEQ